MPEDFDNMSLDDLEKALKAKYTSKLLDINKQEEEDAKKLKAQQEQEQKDSFKAEVIKDILKAVKGDDAPEQHDEQQNEPTDLESLKASIMDDVKAELLKKTNPSVTGNDGNDGLGNDANGSPLGGSQEIPEHVKLMCKFTAKRGVPVVDPSQFEAKFRYENFMKTYEGMGRDSFDYLKATNSDSECDDTTSSNWECEDCFVDGVWLAVLCKSDFLGKVGHRKYAYDKGCGGQVQIKLCNIPNPAHDWGDAASLDPCECISCVSNAFTTYTVQIKKYGDMREICNATLLLAGDEVRTAALASMKARLAERIDNEIATNLIGATHIYTVDLPVCCDEATRTTNCCEWTIDLYDSIIELEADMRAAGYFEDSNPVLLIHPDVAAFLKYRNGLNIPAYIASNIRMDGVKLTGIGNIDVVESCHMNACSGVTDADMALLIDPDRAFAEVWAQRPKYEVDRNIDCDSWTHVVWAYGAFDVLDDAAIGAIQNPACS